MLFFHDLKKEITLALTFLRARKVAGRVMVGQGNLLGGHIPTSLLVIYLPVRWRCVCNSSWHTGFKWDLILLCECLDIMIRFHYSSSYRVHIIIYYYIIMIYLLGRVVVCLKYQMNELMIRATSLETFWLLQGLSLCTTYLFILRI